jgi:hypothetical protein
MMKLLLIVLAVYILGIIINYAIDLQDMEKFNVLSASILNNPQTTDPKAEKVKAKWVYAFVSFVAALMWPMLLISKLRRTARSPFSLVAQTKRPDRDRSNRAD